MSEADVICERTFQVEIDSVVRPVPVRWFTPGPDEKGDWSCVYEISWPTQGPKSRKAYGVDSTQALVLALIGASSFLYSAEPPVFWFEPNDDLGLPVADVLADLRDARSK